MIFFLFLAGCRAGVPRGKPWPGFGNRKIKQIGGRRRSGTAPHWTSKNECLTGASGVATFFAWLPRLGDAIGKELQKCAYFWKKISSHSGENCPSQSTREHVSRHNAYVRTPVQSLETRPKQRSTCGVMLGFYAYISAHVVIHFFFHTSDRLFVTFISACTPVFGIVALGCHLICKYRH
ncbi:hypothetical protein [Burkholderia gladioli]|uniref:hypothetical protein n=1 Tax=Burkholderia gladioli TaxID=28095 RepID=UPI00163DF177|nr:hypothetical protein [Burkholderia gladioli]